MIDVEHMTIYFLRAPYDNIYNTKGVCLRRMAADLPPHASLESPVHYLPGSADADADADAGVDDLNDVAGRLVK